MKNIFYILLALPVFITAQTTDENYVKTAIYLEPTSTTDESKAQVNVTYYDGLGRPIQQVSGKASASGKDIITHIEYDQYGRQTKGYLPYAKTTATLSYDPLAKENTMSFYDDSYYENTPNPYSEQLFEASPLNRVLKHGAPGAPWQVDPDSDTDHTIKTSHQTNGFQEVMRFSVIFNTDNTESPTLECPGWYAQNQLYKTVVKDENWTSGSGTNKTTEEFKDKTGRMVLSRRFDNGEAHDTYYVYDDYDNLTYVLPPKAVDNIIETVINIDEDGEGRNYPWTTLGRVSATLAEDYERAIGDYDNKDILNADLISEFGGQGGFSVVPDIEGNLNLTINIASEEPMPYRTGLITDLKEVGEFPDMEIGHIQGPDYDYFFFIRENKLMVDGDGKVPSLNISLNSGNLPEYQMNYSWAIISDIDVEAARAYEQATSGLDNSELLNTYTPNDFGAMGGVAISLDEHNTLTVSLNITATKELTLRSGAAFPLNIKRPLPDMNLGTITGTGYQYTFSVLKNNFVINGSGPFTNISFGAIRPQNVTYNIVPEALGMCYIYHHDSRNRVIEKHIPDAGWTHMVYDKLDRVVLMQDENLRAFSDGRGNWKFTKYDAFNRTVYTGSLLDSRDRATIQQDLDIVVQPVLNEAPSETFFQDIPQIFYTNNAFPTALANMEVLAINFYDDYGQGYNLVMPPVVYGETIVTDVKGLLTRSYVKVLDSEDWEYNVMGYNNKGMAICNYSSSAFFSNVTTTEMKLSFIGNILESKTTHHRNFEDLITYDFYTYDHMLRPTGHTQRIGAWSFDNPGTLIYNNIYDELGQLKQKKVGSGSFAGTIGGLQTIDYTYNVRGWLKTINNLTALGTDLFAFKLNYNTKDITSSTALYNGNIAETHWKTANDGVLRSYSYKYDDLNRLEKASFVSATNTNKYTEGPISYDKNGNIMSLERWGLTSDGVTLDKIDLLSYHYLPYSNRLEKVTDDADPVAGFNNGTTGNGTDYRYDDNGNIMKDLNKNIGTAMTDGVTYNHLNLPTMVMISEDDWVKYAYNAAGAKVQKIVSSQGNITTTDYANGYIYENGVLQYFSHPEGYVRNDGNGNFKYIYQYKDHLGNVRLSYTQGLNGTAEIIEENNYYAFGLQHKGYNIDVTSTNPGQKIKYNSMEYQDELDLNWYDYMARNYDPSIGRWFNIDPLAETSRRYSPYTYALDNPVYFIDPDGMMATGSGGGESLDEGDFDANVDMGYGRIMNSKNISSSVEFSGASVTMNKRGQEKIDNNVKEYLDRAGLWDNDNNKPNDIYGMDDGNKDYFLKGMVRDVLPLSILAKVSGIMDASGNVNVMYEKNLYALGGSAEALFDGDKTIKVSDKAFLNTRYLFYVLAHELVHAWDIRTGFLSGFNGWDNGNMGKYSVARAVTEVRAYEIQMFFGYNLNREQRQLYDGYRKRADDKSRNNKTNYRIKSYPVFFSNIQK